MSDKKTSLFYGSQEELYITDIVCAVQEAPSIRKLNTHAMYIQRNTKQERDKLANREVLEKVKDEFIQCIIYRQMWDSDRCWNKVGEIKKRLEL